MKGIALGLIVSVLLLYGLANWHKQNSEELRGGYVVTLNGDTVQFYGGTLINSMVGKTYIDKIQYSIPNKIKVEQVNDTIQ